MSGYGCGSTRNHSRVVGGGRGLAPVRYTSPEFYALEVERIFRREWLCLGRADEVAAPGDYLTLDLLGEPLIMVRDATGVVRVLSAVCRHRVEHPVCGTHVDADHRGSAFDVGLAGHFLRGRIDPV